MERVVSLNTLERSCRVLSERQYGVSHWERKCGTLGPTGRGERKGNAGTHNHFVNEDTERPPVHGGGMARRLDDLGSDVLYEEEGNDATALANRTHAAGWNKGKDTHPPFLRMS